MDGRSGETFREEVTEKVNELLQSHLTTSPTAYDYGIGYPVPILL